MNYFYYIALVTIISVCFFNTVAAECNGGVSLCSRSYSDITQLITHDSYALSPNIAATQDDDIIDQLNDGVRGIKLSAVPSTTDPLVIHLCHTYCTVLDAGLVTDTLNNITTWLEANPKEIVTIMWNNLYNFKATQIAAVYRSSNIMPIVYTHNQSNPWPTLQEMIDCGKRVVNFIDAEADPEQVPWLMDQFSRVFETPYDNTDINAFNCNVDRIGQDLNPKDLMYVMNHFVYGVIELGALKLEIPLKEQAQFTNTQQSLADHVNNCINVFQKKPNFIEVDFYTIGDALSVVANLNGVSPSPLLSKKMTPLDLPSKNISTAIRHSSLSPTEHVFIDNSVGENSGSQIKANLLLWSMSAVLISSLAAFNY